MNLNDQQKQEVRDWVAAGASLSEVQQRLRDEHRVSMTYMDVRLLVLELGANVQDKPEPKADPAIAAADAGGEELPGEEPSGGVSVTLDRVVQAGALASGAVTFPDGVTGKWMLDQMGRLGLSSVSRPGYRPSQEDLAEFQTKLQSQLASHGY